MKLSSIFLQYHGWFVIAQLFWILNSYWGYHTTISSWTSVNRVKKIQIKFYHKNDKRCQKVSVTEWYWSLSIAETCLLASHIILSYHRIVASKYIMKLSWSYHFIFNGQLSEIMYTVHVYVINHKKVTLERCSISMK